MTESDTSRSEKSINGRWLVTGLFFLAGLAMVAFYYNAKHRYDPAPAAAQWGRPTNPVRVVLIDAAAIGNDRVKLLNGIKSIPADVYFIRNVEGAMVDTVARVAGLDQGNRPLVFYPAQNIDGPGTSIGNAILSNLPLYEGRSMPNKGGSFGVWTVAVSGEQKFMLACIGMQTPPDKESAMLHKAWLELGSPPMIIAGDRAGAAIPDSVTGPEGFLLMGDWNAAKESTDGVVVCR